MTSHSAYAYESRAHQDGGGSRRPVSRSFIGALMAILLVASLFTASPASAAGCQNDALVPQLYGANINQGLPTSPLVRSKDTMVKFHLMLPACSVGTAQQIQITGATLNASEVIATGNRSLGVTLSNLNTLSPPPAVAPYTDPTDISKTEPSANTTADPLFVVPASYLTSSTPTVGFTAGFTATVTYTVSGSSTPRTTTFSATAPVHPRTNDLRILSVPMGDPTGLANNTSPQFSSTALTNVVNGFATLARLYPVRQGTGSLTSTNSGIRYTVDTGALLDVSPYMTSGSGTKKLFCGTSGNFTDIQTRLANYLVQYNTANSVDKAADRVLGVIDQTISSNCADGFAGVGTREAWARSLNNSPNSTGGIIGMEEGHNAGAVSTLRADRGSAYHSPNSEADVTSPNRGFNLVSRSYIANDRSIMRYSADNATWNNNTTLLEKPDWEQVFCRFGGPTTPNCATPGIEGAGAVGAGPATLQLNLVGVTDGATPEGAGSPTVVYDAYAAPGPSTHSGPSDYNLIVTAPSGTSSQPVPVTALGSLHDDHHNGGVGHTVDGDLNFFSVSYSIDANATRWELWRGTPSSGGIRLAWREVNGAPTVSNLTLSAPGQDPPPPVTTTINFDDLQDGDVVGEQYGPKGVTFEGDTNPRTTTVIVGDCTAGHDPCRFPNATTSSTPFGLFNKPTTLPVGGIDPVPSSADIPLRMVFDEGQDKVAMNIGNSDLPGTTVATLTGYDAAGDPVPGAQSQVSNFGPNVTTEIEIDAGSGCGCIFSVNLDYGDSALGEEIDDLFFGHTPTLPPLPPGTKYDAAATVRDDKPEDLRGAFFAQCPNLRLPLAVGLMPDTIDYSTTPPTVIFRYKFDPASACENGGTATLAFRADDGFQITDFATANAVTTTNVPLAVISSPVITSATLEHQYAALSGQGYDLTEGVLPGDRLQWFLSGPGYPEVAVGTGNQLDVPPPATGWPIPSGSNSATYTVRLVVTDNANNTSSTTAPLLIRRDSDNDGIPTDIEKCYAHSGDPTPDSNPFNAYSDADSDAYMNVDDPEACSPATFYKITAKFDPETLYIPSTGNTVAMYVSSKQRNIKDVIGTTVKISRINGMPIDNTGCVYRPGVATFIGINQGWSVSNQGVGGAKFDRQSLIDYLSCRDLLERNVPITITGQGTTDNDGSGPQKPTTWTFEGINSPFVKRAN